MEKTPKNNMRVVCLHDKAELEGFLRQDIALNIYSLGDLDEFFWPFTQWYGLKSAGELKAVALLYGTDAPPVLLTLASPQAKTELRALLTLLLPLLPRKVYAHLSLGLEDILETAFQLESFGIHHKMILANLTRFQDFLSPNTMPLTREHLAEVTSLYAVSYPENAFDPRMLETGQFSGIWEDNQLVSIAGIHVYSPGYRVAAVGNVTTHPQYRNRGYGKMVTATLILSLLEKVDYIGLNVKANNWAAIHSYQQLGFEISASYHEMMAIGN